MKRKRIKIKFLVFILSVTLIVIILLIVAKNYQKNEPQSQQNNENVEKDLSVTTTTNAEESNEESEASEESENEEEINSPATKLFNAVKKVNKKVKQQKTVSKLISEDPDVNLKELNDRTFSYPKRKEIGGWAERNKKKNIEERKTKE